VVREIIGVDANCSGLMHAIRRRPDKIHTMYGPEYLRHNDPSENLGDMVAPEGSEDLLRRSAENGCAEKIC